MGLLLAGARFTIGLEVNGHEASDFAEDRAPYLVDEEILSGEPVIVERNGQAVAAVIPMADYEAFLAWRATLEQPWPGEPPRTPEGDLEALAAVERIRTMFSDTPPEMWTEIISNPLYQLDNLWLLNEAEDDEN